MEKRSTLREGIGKGGANAVDGGEGVRRGRRKREGGGGLGEREEK